MASVELQAAAVSLATAEVMQRLTQSGAEYEIVHQSVNGVDVLGFASVCEGRNFAEFAKKKLDSLPPGDVAFMYHSETLTYGQTKRKIAALAVGLSTMLDVTPGDRVSLAMSNCSEWCLTFIATVALGAIIVRARAISQCAGLHILSRLHLSWFLHRCPSTAGGTAKSSSMD